MRTFYICNSVFFTFRSAFHLQKYQGSFWIAISQPTNVRKRRKHIGWISLCLKTPRRGELANKIQNTEILRKRKVKKKYPKYNLNSYLKNKNPYLLPNEETLALNPACEIDFRRWKGREKEEFFCKILPAAESWSSISKAPLCSHFWLFSSLSFSLRFLSRCLGPLLIRYAIREHGLITAGESVMMIMFVERETEKIHESKWVNYSFPKSFFNLICTLVRYRREIRGKSVPQWMLLFTKSSNLTAFLSLSLWQGGRGFKGFTEWE